MRTRPKPRPAVGPETLLLRATPENAGSCHGCQVQCKHGMGLSHVPTGVLAANQAYFLIAALAWNLKTWMVNLLDLDDGAKLRFKRFLYLWIYQAGVLARTGREALVLKLPAGEYYQRFSTAFARIAALAT